MFPIKTFVFSCQYNFFSCLRCHVPVVCVKNNKKPCGCNLDGKTTKTRQFMTTNYLTIGSQWIKTQNNTEVNSKIYVDYKLGYGWVGLHCSHWASHFI